MTSLCGDDGTENGRGHEAEARDKGRMVLNECGER